MENTKILAVVPARSGSKGIPGKNIRPFLGKPLLAWSVEAAKKSGMVDRVVVLTDSEEYARIGREHGAEVPFLEPADLATDTSHVFFALKHLLEELEQREGYVPDYVVLLEPTAPARRPQHVGQLLKVLVDAKADAAFAVREVPGGFNAHWQFYVSEDGVPKITTGETVGNIIRRRQLLPKTYARGGSIYACKPSLLRKDNPDMYGDNTRVMIVDPKYMVDLDTLEDWAIAEKQVAVLVAEEAQ